MISFCFEFHFGWRDLAPAESEDELFSCFFDGDIVLNLFDALDFFGEVASAVFLVARIDEAAQLHHAFERLHLHVLVFVLRVLGQTVSDARRIGFVIDAFARALCVTITGAAGHAADHRQCADAEDQCREF